MKVLIIGKGALAFCYAHWLGSRGHSVSLYQYPDPVSTGALAIKTCSLKINNIHITDLNPPLLIGSNEDTLSLLGSEVILFIGSIERFQEYLFANPLTSVYCENIVLFTSCYCSLSELYMKISCSVLPVYPIMVCEEWNAHLAAFGSSVLEADSVCSPSPDWSPIIRCLKELGFDLSIRDMTRRFRSRFAMTSFSYSYIRSSSLYCYDGRVEDFNVKTALAEMRQLLFFESDLLVGLDQLPTSLDRLWLGRYLCGEPGWILEVLMRYKIAKTDYFIRRLPIGYKSKSC